MEIQETRSNGLKETHIGLIPEDWEVVKLGDVFDIQQGKAMSPESRSKTPQYPFLRTLNVLWGRVDLSTLDNMHFTTEEISRLHLQPNDLLVCEGGEIGRTAMWKGKIKFCGHQNHIHRLRKRGDDIWPEFYMYWMQAAFLQLGLYAGEGIKTTIPNLSRGRLQTFILPKPSLSEQQKIALVLSKIQQAIEHQDKIIEITRNLKKSLMQKLFTEGIGHTEFKDSEIGQIPKSWEVVKLRDIREKTATVDPRRTPNKKFKYVDVSSISRDFLSIIDYKEYWGRDAPSRARKAVRKDDIIFATVRPSLKRVAVIPEIYNGEICSTAFCVIRCKRELALPDFVFSYISTDDFVKRVSGLQKGTNYPAITDSDVLTQEIPLPSISEQQQIADSSKILDKKMRTEDKRKVLLQQLFKTMLHKLMTGEIRVKDVDLSFIGKMGVQIGS